MSRIIRKPQDTPFKRLATRLTELNIYLPLFPGYSGAKKMPPEDLNEIMLHALQNGWENQAYLQVWAFDMKSYKATYKLFERMDVAEK